MKTIYIALFLLSSTLLHAQIEGDDLFGEDFVTTIELDFPTSDFWSILTSNYDEGENEYTWADLTLTDQYGVHQFDSVSVRLKGNSSYNHPGDKKSFKIDFNKADNNQNYDGLKKLNFSNGFKDPSVIREKVYFDVCRAAGVPAPRTSFANVTMNGTAWGFYTIVEQIDDQFLDWKIEDDDGNLFKAGDNFGGGPGGGGDAADLLYYGDEAADYQDKYDLKTNEEENDWSDLIELIDFINNSSDADFEAGIGDRIELADFMRAMALNSLFSSLDTYTGSARNYYLYHNLTTDRWEWIKWDGNESFGLYTNNAGNMLTLALDYHDTDRPLLNRLFDSPTLYAAYLNEVCSLQENFFNSDYMDARIDVLKALIEDHVYADDNKMYTDAQFDTNIESDVSAGGGGPGGGTVYGLKSFVAERSDYVASQLDCSGYVGLSENEVAPINVYPNPATTSVRIEWETEGAVIVSLFDGSGRLMSSSSHTGVSTAELDVSGLASGMYWVRLLDADGVATGQRLVLR